MYNSFEQRYFVKKLHFDAGITIIDHIYDCHRNSIDFARIDILRLAVFNKNNCCYFFNDTVGVCFDYLCKTIVQQKSDSNIFIIKDDLSTEKTLALYFQHQNVFLCRCHQGYQMDSFYLRLNTGRYLTKKYIKLAEKQFYYTI